MSGVVDQIQDSEQQPVSREQRSFVRRFFTDEGMHQIASLRSKEGGGFLFVLGVIATVLTILGNWMGLLTIATGLVAITLFGMIALRRGPYPRAAVPLIIAGAAFVLFGALWLDQEPELSAEEIAEIAIAVYQRENPDADLSTVEAFRESVETALRSGDQRRVKATRQYTEGLVEGDDRKQDQAITDLERLAEDQSRAVDESAEQAAATWKQVGAFAFNNETERALNAYREAVRLTPDDLVAWNQLGHLLRRIGNLRGAEEAYRRLIADPVSTDKIVRAVALGNLGLVARTRGDLEGAEAYQKKSLALNEELGSKEGMARDLGNLGVIARKRRDLEGAEAYYKESLALNEELGRKEGMAMQLGNLGNVAFDRGDRAGACASYRQAEGLFAEIGMRRELEHVRAAIAARCPDDAP